MRAPKASNAIKRQRMDRMMELRGQGLFRYECVDICAAEWNMSKRGIDIYWNASSKLLKESFTDEDLVSSYKYIRDRNIDNNPAIAVKCNDSIAKLKKGGFNGTEIVFKIEHKDEDEGNKDNQSA